MKKFILIAAVVVSMAAIAKAQTFNVPMGEANSLPTADYGGVDRSTIAFSSANVLCFQGQGVVYGFIASSFTPTNSDFMVFRDTVSLSSGAISGANRAIDDYNTNEEFARVYFSTTSSISVGGVAITGSDKQGTTYKFLQPIRVWRGLAVKCTTNVINMITVLWQDFSNP